MHRTLDTLLAEYGQCPVFADTTIDSVHVAGPDGTTALHIAVAHNDREAVDLLLDAGADINACQKDGISALHLALEENHALLVHHLVTRGARTDWPDLNREKLDFFLSACHGGELSPLAQVLVNMADFPTFAGINVTGPNVRGLFGDTPLHIVMHWNDLDAARTLIAAGANVNARDEHGYTPLHEACANGNPEMVELLLNHGADLFARNDGDYAFTHARLHGQDAICDLLSPYYDRAWKADPQVEIKSRIRQLREELQEWETMLATALAEPVGNAPCLS